MQKVSEKQILEVFENNEDCKSKTQIAAELGITIQALNRRLAKMSVRVKDHVQAIAKKHAYLYIGHLEQQSRAGKTQATEALLKLAEVSSTINIGDGQWNINISKVLSAPATEAEAKKE